MKKGCLTWFGLLSHKYYHKEVLFTKKADVEFAGVYKKLSKTEFAKLSDSEQTNENMKAARRKKKLVNTYKETFNYYMNPWDDQFTFGWDARSEVPENYVAVIENQKKLAEPSRLFIADFRYETLGFRYEIDKYMSLKVKKTVLLKAHPMVLKYNSIKRGRSGTEPLRDGVYLLKVALQKDYLDPSAPGVVIRHNNEDGEKVLCQKPF